MKKTSIFISIIVFFSITITTSCRGPESNRRRPQTGISSTAASQDEIPPIKPTIKPTIKFFIENSGSMDGYVNEGNKFTNTVSTFATDLSILYDNNINLYYINSEIIPLNIGDITKFSTHLNTNAFRSAGGHRGETHVDQILTKVLQHTNDTTISILVTDGIFSPGSGKDADKYISDQYNSIKKNIADFIGTMENPAVMLYCFNADFIGVFYDKFDNRFPQTRMELPYYVWIIGDMDYIKKMINTIPTNVFRDTNLHKVFSIANANQQIDYAVKKGSGNFKLDMKDPKKTILNLKKEVKGIDKKVRFAVNADLSSFLLDDSYLLDKSNYELNNNNYKLTISKSSSANYTHQFNFESDNVHKGSISLELLSKIPTWVEEVNDSIGERPIEYKTYGIKYQIEGVYEAFSLSGDSYTSININIK